MGCKQSKAALQSTPEAVVEPSRSMDSSSKNSRSTINSRRQRRDPSRLYNLLLSSSSTDDNDQLRKAITPETTGYQDPVTHQTALHVTVMHRMTSSAVVDVLPEILHANPTALRLQDVYGHIPLHYAIAPEFPTNHNNSKNTTEKDWWKSRIAVTKLLIATDPQISRAYLARNDVMYGDQNAGGCSPLYYALQTLPDDSTPAPAQPPTLEFVHVLVKNTTSPANRSNAFDSDKPLALLYRRFTRQFDLAEKFFPGDNSRPEIVHHRTKYKTAAGNTWKIIELLLSQHESHRTVHRAVCGETPPDLLRYIVETNAPDLTVRDEYGNLPLHYAAKNVSSNCFPAFYSKYVIDELLYKYPEAAAKADSDGKYPLTLAVQAGKQWIGGGIKSLYDAYPEALEQIDLNEHAALKHALSSMENDNNNDDDDDDEIRKEEKVSDDIIRDNQHDAIMLVQQPNVDVSEVVTSMWAHEEDAGVQMLGCVAISKLLNTTTTGSSTHNNNNNSNNDNESHTMRIALSAVPAVVNAMKAHPNEVIVQEKACHTLCQLASSDGKREISFVASGAVAAIVGAMQAHVSDNNVQEEACAAITRIIRYGGADRATIVASVSGLTAIVNALAAHPDVRQVQRHGVAALRELTEYRNNANLPELPRSQTESLLVAAKEQFPHECGDAVDVLLSRLS